MNCEKMIETECPILFESIQLDITPAENGGNGSGSLFIDRREGFDFALKRLKLRGFVLRWLVLTIAVFVFDNAFARVDTLKLKNGDTLTGNVVRRADQAIVLKHPVLGELVIPLSQVDPATLTQFADDWPDQPGLTAAVRPSTVDSSRYLDALDTGKRSFLDKRLLVEWDKHLGAGLSGSGGNSDTLDITAVASAKYEDAEKRWDISSEYFFGKTEGRTHKSKFDANVIRDWMWAGSAWFASVRGSYEADKFEDWDHRVGLFAGPGYQFIKTEETSLLGRLALGVTRTIGGEDDEWTPELQLGIDGSWKFNENSRFAAKAEYFPNLIDPKEFRSMVSVEWITKVSQDGALNLHIGVKNEYDSEAGGEAKNNDVDYYARIGYDF